MAQPRMLLFVFVAALAAARPPSDRKAWAALYQKAPSWRSWRTCVLPEARWRGAESGMVRKGRAGRQRAADVAALALLGLRSAQPADFDYVRAAFLAVSEACAAAGLLFHAPTPLLYLLAIVWGVAVVADSAQLSALVAQYSPRDHVGTALTVQTCAGFLLTMGSIRLVPLAAQAIGWQWVFTPLVPGPVFGVIALRGLSRHG